jgi:arsenate reductase
MSNENDNKQSVLFLCTGNACRSQMAEALLRYRSPQRFTALSAGIEPKENVHPMTLRVLGELGIDTSGLRPKSSTEFLGRVRVTYAVIVCERAQQACPKFFPFTLQNYYWPFEDPAAVEGTELEKLEAFRKTRDEIDNRIKQFLREEGGR